MRDSECVEAIRGIAEKREGTNHAYGGKLRIPMGMTSAPYGFYESGGLHCFSDSSWGKQPIPYGGYVIMYRNGAVDWSAKKLRVVADSTCEAETAIASRASKAVLFVRGLLSFLGDRIVGGTAILVDNSALIQTVEKDGATSRTRYFDRATMLIKQCCMLGSTLLGFVRTSDEVADIFTKATDTATFEKMSAYILNLPAAALSSAQGKLAVLMKNFTTKLPRTTLGTGLART